jgi:hypothetical protein
MIGGDSKFVLTCTHTRIPFTPTHTLQYINSPMGVEIGLFPIKERKFSGVDTSGVAKLLMLEKSFSPIYLSRLWINFMFLDSDPHWARHNLISCVLCAGVNILCKHVQMCVCVCVCALAYSWIRKWKQTT